MNPPRKHPNFGKAHRMNFNKKPKGESYANGKGDLRLKGGTSTKNEDQQESYAESKGQS
tara:strand:+ start:400 stop:576 length:177 start_codon:yes stop_codon:yes gene_type:complete